MDRTRMCKAIRGWSREEFVSEGEADCFMHYAGDLLRNYPSMRFLVGEELTVREIPYWIQVLGRDFIIKELPRGATVGVEFPPDKCRLVPSSLLPLRTRFPRRKRVQLDVQNAVVSNLPETTRRLTLRFNTDHGNYDRENAKLRIISALGDYSILFTVLLSDCFNWSNDGFSCRIDLDDPAFARFEGLALMTFQLSIPGSNYGELESISTICGHYPKLG